jgi:hypothetical protein
MWKERMRAHAWKLAVLVISIVVPLLLDVPRIVKASGGAVAIALAVYEFSSRRRKRRTQEDTSHS